jgi:pimeloyl-ACP methyl ester carboxylesterase
VQTRRGQVSSAVGQFSLMKGKGKKMKCKLTRITVHYETFGEGKPIIMLHGWPLDHRIMVNIMEPLFENRDGWKRIYPDLPGMGETPGMDWIANQDQILDILLEFVDAIVPDQRFVVAGFSYGGYLGRGMVYQRSSMMDGLCLIAPTILADDTQRTLPSHKTLVKDPAVVSGLERNLAEAFEGFAVVQSRELLDTFIAVSLPARKIADYEFLSKLSDNYAFSFDVDTLPEPFHGPTLMLMGRQDSACGYHDAWSILENYPRGTFVVLDRAGHGLMFEQRNIFNTLVNEWIDRVEENTQAV